MACKVYEQLASEEKSARREWAYFAYDENKTLRGISDRKSKRLAKDAMQKMSEAGNRMWLHRQNCENCKAEDSGETLMLKLHEVARSGIGSDLSRWDHIYKYEVQGMPLGEEAFIAEIDHRWQLLRVSQGKKVGDWTGDYDSPEAALQGLEKSLQSQD